MVNATLTTDDIRFSKMLLTWLPLLTRDEEGDGHEEAGRASHLRLCVAVSSNA